MLKTFREGQLVSVATDGGGLDGVVAHVPSLVKIEVAVEQPEAIRCSGPRTRRR